MASEQSFPWFRALEKQLSSTSVGPCGRPAQVKRTFSRYASGRGNIGSRETSGQLMGFLTLDIQTHGSKIFSLTSNLLPRIAGNFAHFRGQLHSVLGCTLTLLRSQGSAERSFISQ